MWGPTDLIAVEVPFDEVPFAVPIEASTGFVGPRFMEFLAAEIGGVYVGDPPDIGLMDDFAVLRGRWLDPDKVHPLVVEFYEHTTRFSLSVVPEWNRWYRPLFLVFRQLVARRIGQFNLPFDERDEKRGMEMHIDTVDFDHDKVIDLRAWVRTYAGTDETIYCGVYTTVRVDDLGYVSVGFPLPNANLTATLIPANIGGDEFILRTHEAPARVAGDYFVFADEATGRLTVVRIRGLREEIQVYARGDRLLADHRFYFARANFLTLHYTAQRKATPPSQPGTARDLLIKEVPTVAERGNPVRL
jgi:hypothetical protein